MRTPRGRRERVARARSRGGNARGGRSTTTAVVLAFVVGCGGGAGRDRVEKSDTYVFDKGKEPKQILRYDVPAGTRQSLDLVIDMTIGMPAAGVPITKSPRMTLVEDVAVTASDAKAGADLTMTARDLRLEDRPGSQRLPGTASAEQIRGMRFAGHLTPNGVMRDSRADASPFTDQSLDAMTAILPDVPVGVGARWRVEETVRQGGMKLQYETSYELTALEGSVATIDAEMDITAPEQPMDSDGVHGTLESVTGHAKMDQTLDLHTMASHVTGTLSMQMTVAVAGQEAELDEQMALQILPDGETPAPPADE